MDWDLVLTNLINTGIGAAIFTLAYFGNMLVGCYYNVKLLKEKFEVSKIVNSLLKILCIGGGCICASLVITILPQFANLVGWTIPEDYADVIQGLAIIGIFLYSSCKYLFELIGKIRDVLNYKTEEARAVERKKAELTMKQYSK